MQIKGVCIGAKVAPVLSNIFRSKDDTKVADDMVGDCIRLFRYADDFLVIVKFLKPEIVHVLDVIRKNWIRTQLHA